MNSSFRATTSLLIRTRPYMAVALLFLAGQALGLFFMGQPWTCTCGYLSLWEGDVYSIGNSQQLSDWYTFSHVIHGFLFFFALRYFFPRMSLLQSFSMALALEIGWELFENSAFIIERYRAQALAVGYVGDSILNSLSDTIAMAVGYVLALRLSTRTIIALILLFEIFVGVMIRDNLTLNIINLIYPSEIISAWQRNA